MKSMRWCIAFILCCAVVLALVGCGGSDDGSDEEAALAAAISAELGGAMDITIDSYRVVDDWAGVWIAAPTSETDPAAFLLERGEAGWQVVDYGTGLAPEDWAADGAPQELAEWF